jgi:hypothetical protein
LSIQELSVMALDPVTTLETALKINRPAAKLLVGGFLLLTLAVVLGNQLQDSGLSFWTIPLALLGLSVLVAIFARMPDMLATLACWTLVALALLFAVGVTGQVLAGNTLPYAKLDCLTGFWKPGACNTSPVVVPDAPAAVLPEFEQPQAAPAAEEPTPVAPATTAEPAAAEAAAPDTSAEAVAVPVSIVPEVDRATATVYIQFAGFDRDTVKQIAKDLVALGWPIQGAEQGGERYAHAAGLNEVRFFHPDDKVRADVLAVELSGTMAGKPVKVLDVSDSAYAKDTPGHFEIWISK